MTTAYRDTATRCRRCERMTNGVADFTAEYREYLVTVTIARAKLCVRCRGEIADAIEKLLSDGGSR